jgi:hypothetical protein
MICFPKTPLRLAQAFGIAVIAFIVTGCVSETVKPDVIPSIYNNARLQQLNLNNPVSPTVRDEPVSLAAAKNEWTSFQLQVSGLPPAQANVAYTLRFQSFNLSAAQGSIATENLTVAQIISMPVDVNRAGFVRHTGLAADAWKLPRALLPMPVHDGRVNLSAARSPSAPTNATAFANGEPVQLWVDLHIPPGAPAGNYGGVCDVLATGIEKPIATVPIQLEVFNFVIPDDRHLNLVGEIEWDALTRLYPQRFEAVTPKFMSRSDERYAQAVKTLDQLVALAQAHRAVAVVPRLQPIDKWPGGRPPTVDWADYDSIVAPWMRGEIFRDRVPLGYWPLPTVFGLSTYDAQSRQQYWANAAGHFDQNDWLDRAPVVLEKPTSGRANLAESIELSSDAAGVLAAHSRVRVAVPLEDDQIQLETLSSRNLIKPQDAKRLITTNPGVVFSSPIQSWPSGVERPSRWMRTDLAGLIPYIGAGGDERDVRLWAWLSFLPLPRPPIGGSQYGPVQFIRWAGALPQKNSPAEPADPNELIWFYPGSWFGLDEPVPTVQLKWLRRAQQDFEYLYLARQRGDALNTVLMARLMTKPVEIQPNQPADPTYGLMSGTADAKAWDESLRMLAKRILLREPGTTPDPERDYVLNVEMLRWGQTLEHPVLMGRTTDWGLESINNQRSIALKLGIDIYNASDARPDQNTLRWTRVPAQSGWQVRPQPLSIPSLATYRVQRFEIEARVDPLRLRRQERTPVQITFTNGYNQNTSELVMMLPVAPTERREMMLDINDGSLTDWAPEDAIQNGPMIRMFNRPALQNQEIQVAATPTQVFTNWSDDNFYLAFKVGGLTDTRSATARNFINYQLRRAWGEDLVEMLMQPMYADSSLGPITHLVFKPNGVVWVERKSTDRSQPDPWQPYQGTGLRFTSRPEDSEWRAEIAIPWRAITDADRKLPVALRFNFIQHTDKTGESASWAGPIDFGRDDAFTGLLILREPETPGVLRARE